MVDNGVCPRGSTCRDGTCYSVSIQIRLTRPLGCGLRRRAPPPHGKKSGWLSRPPSWGGGNRDESLTAPLTPSAASRPFVPSLLLHVVSLECVRLCEGPFRVLDRLELVRDELHTSVHEVADRRAHPPR